MSDSRTTSIIAGVATLLVAGPLIFLCVAVLQVGSALESNNALGAEIRDALERNNSLAESTDTHANLIAEHTADHGWEYDVVSVSDVEWSTTGRKLGEDGWEIITARRASGADDQFLYECIVRRPARGASNAPGEQPGDSPVPSAD